ILAVQSAPIRERMAFLNYPYTIDYEEDYLLVHAWRMHQGLSYIQPLDDGPPYIVGTYMPLFPKLASWVSDWSVPQLKGGRVLAFASCVAIALVIALLLMAGGVNFPVACLLGFWFLLQRDTLKWMPLY